MFNRRRFLGGELGLALAGTWSTVRKATSEPAARDFFKELGERVSVSLVAFGTLLMIPALAQHTIHVTPSTVHWGFFSADAKPVLTVKSGEVVTIDTICGIPEMLEQLGAITDDPIREMKEMYSKVKERGPGPHFLTGPVAIEGAMPAERLEELNLRLGMSAGDLRQ